MVLLILANLHEVVILASLKHFKWIPGVIKTIKFLNRRKIIKSLLLLINLVLLEVFLKLKTL
jgi:hypothetical protein